MRNVVIPDEVHAVFFVLANGHQAGGLALDKTVPFGPSQVKRSIHLQKGERSITVTWRGETFPVHRHKARYRRY